LADGRFVMMGTPAFGAASAVRSLQNEPNFHKGKTVDSALENLGLIPVTAPNVPPARLVVPQAAVKKALTYPKPVVEGERSQRRS
jgi:hypothetical protein